MLLLFSFMLRLLKKDHCLVHIQRVSGFVQAKLVTSYIDLCIFFYLPHFSFQVYKIRVWLLIFRTGGLNFSGLKKSTMKMNE